MNVCRNPDTLTILMNVMKITKVVFTIIPIILMIFLIIDWIKVIPSGKEEDIRNCVVHSIKRVVSALIVFFVPTFIMFFNGLLGDLGVDYSECLANANESKINSIIYDNAKELYDKAFETKTLDSINKARSAISKLEDSDNKKSMLSKLDELQESIIKEKEEVAKKEQEEREKEKEKNKGTAGRYYAPLQDTTYKFQNYGTTGGCGNTQVVHDIYARVGTPIYAAMDGTVEFVQNYCAAYNQLYSYGNKVTIKASNGDYVVYGHLSKFPDYVERNAGRLITETCPKKSDGSAPCGAGACPGGTAKKSLGSYPVKKGDIIGYTGDTGNSLGPHLHVEIHENGVCVSDLNEAFGMK